jgi:uncharacterized membrane protein (DUF485 family)
MMGIFGKIFGTDKAIESGLNMIYKAGDALFYTDQEKAADKENKVKQVHQFMNDWMETTKGQNIARRLLAVMITTVWLFLYLVGILLSVIAPWVATEISVKLMESARVLESNADMMSGAVMLILAFYFAAPHMDKIVEGALNKFGGKKEELKK